jgi:hypothetical protein
VSLTVDNAAALVAALEPMLTWSYSVSLSATLSAQDELWFSPGFNAQATDDAPGSVPPKLQPFFEAAVGMEAALPGFAAAFAALDGRDPKSAAPPALIGQLEPFVAFAEALAEAWPLGPVADMFASSVDSATWLWLTLAPAATTTNPNAYALTMARPASPAPADPWPQLALGAAAFAANPAEQPIEGGRFDAVVRAFAAKPDLSNLRLLWPSLALRERMTADFAALIRRNAEFGDKAADSAFVLHTPEIAFPTSAVPLIVSKTRLIILPKWPLAEILADLMGVLAKIGSEASEPVLSFVCSYSYQMLPQLFPGPGQDGLRAQMPVLIGSDLPVPPAGIAILTTRLAREIDDWMKRINPSRRGAALEFALTLFGTPPVKDGQRLALVQFESISILLDGDAPTFWPAPASAPPAQP